MALAASRPDLMPPDEMTGTSTAFTTSAVETSESGVQSTVNPVMINGKEVLANAGDIVLKGSKEFIWDGTSWAEFGDLSSLKNLLGEMAYVDNGTANYTPAGNVTGTIVGTEGTVNVEGTTAGSVTADVLPYVTDQGKITYEVTLTKPGDFYEFIIDVVNDGSIDAMIDSVTKTPNLTETQQKYLNYIIEYQNGEQITTKQLVRSEAFVRMKVRVEYKEDLTASELPSEDETLNLVP